MMIAKYQIYGCTFIEKSIRNIAKYIIAPDNLFYPETLFVQIE